MTELEDTLTDIDEFDLNSYEIKIWKCLLQNGVSTAGDLSEQTDVPRSRSYDVLESLEKKGFVVQQIGKPIKYLAVPPREVLRRVKGEVRADAEDRVSHLDGLQDSDLLRQLQELYESDMDPSDADDIIQHAASQRATKKRLATLIRNAEDNVRIVTHNPGLYDDTSFTNAFSTLSHRDIPVQILTASQFPDDLPSNVAVQEHDIDAEFALIDDSDAFIYITNPSHTEAKGMTLNAPFFTNALRGLFDNAWDAA